MISAICVYNDDRAYREIFLESLRKQSYPYELIPLDNRERRFPSAAAALNHGAALAKGEYLLFVHQDLELPSNDWLEQAVGMIAGLDEAGIVGVAGMKEGKGSYEELKRGNLICGGTPWNLANRIDRPEEVQTLDECLFIIPSEVFAGLKFDDRTFDGWHCYAADYCLSLRPFHRHSYVIPLPAFHRSLRVNTNNLLTYQVRLFRKHAKDTKRINTTNVNLTGLGLRMRVAYRRIQSVLRRLFPEWIEMLRKELEGCRSLLDLGCGPNSPIHYFHIPETVGVDVYEPYLEESRKKAIHTKYLKADITKMSFPEHSFDVVFCSEVIEHLPKDKGLALIERMVRWAKTKVILTTPNGHVHQENFDDNESQRHLSTWTAGELERLGFRVSGISGLKFLRTDFGRLKYRPYVAWNLLSNMSQKITYRTPRWAFQFFAVKNIEPPPPDVETRAG